MHRSVRHLDRTREHPIDTSIYADRDWDAIALAYVQGTPTVEAICAQHDIPRRVLYNRAHAEGWPLRINAPEGARRRLMRERRFARLVNLALESRLRALEKRFADPDAASAADAERDSRTLAALLRLIDKLRALEEKTAASGGASSPAGRAKRGAHDANRDADRLRDEIARRLERLRAGASLHADAPAPVRQDRRGAGSRCRGA